MNSRWQDRAVRMKRAGFRIWKIAETVRKPRWMVVDCLVKSGVFPECLFKATLVRANRREV